MLHALSFLNIRRGVSNLCMAYAVTFEEKLMGQVSDADSAIREECNTLLACAERDTNLKSSWTQRTARPNDCVSCPLETQAKVSS